MKQIMSSDVRRAWKSSGHQVGKSRWSHSTVVFPICLLIYDKLDKILHTHWGLGENKMLSTCHLSVTRLQNQIWNAPQKIPRTNYAKWVDHVIDTRGMWCAMFDVSVQHSWNTFDPEWISLGHTLTAEKWGRWSIFPFLTDGCISIKFSGGAFREGWCS